MRWWRGREKRLLGAGATGDVSSKLLAGFLLLLTAMPGRGWLADYSESQLGAWSRKMAIVENKVILIN